MAIYHVVANDDEFGRKFDGNINATDIITLLFYELPKGIHPTTVTKVELLKPGTGNAE